MGHLVREGLHRHLAGSVAIRAQATPSSLLFVSCENRSDEDSDDEVLAALARALAGTDCALHRVVLPVGAATQDPADLVPWLQKSALDRRLGAPLVVGGFSFGARVAAASAEALGAAGVLCFGFPFHRRGDPLEEHGRRALSALSLPVLIAQGERDAHGDRQRVRGMELPNNVSLCWLPDGNHRFVPRRRSEVCLQDNAERAAQAAAAFIAGLSRGL